MDIFSYMISYIKLNWGLTYVNISYPESVEVFQYCQGIKLFRLWIYIHLIWPSAEQVLYGSTRTLFIVTHTSHIHKTYWLSRLLPLKSALEKKETQDNQTTLLSLLPSSDILLLLRYQVSLLGPITNIHLLIISCIFLVISEDRKKKKSLNVALVPEQYPKIQVHIHKYLDIFWHCT